MSADLERDLREMLQRNADEVEWTPTPTSGLVRRARLRRVTVASMAVIILLAVAGTVPLAQRWIEASKVDFTPINPGPDAPPVTPPNVFGTLNPALAYGVDGDIYVADRNGASAVRIADGAHSEGPEQCTVERQNEYVAFGSAWSPDGRHLAYWDWRPCPIPEHGNQWGTVIVIGQEGNVVTSFPGQGWLISWSPDSTRVAVWNSLGPYEAWVATGDARNPEDSTIGVYGLDGVRQATLTVPASLMPSGDVSPVWSRDGSSLLLSGVQVPLDGSEPRKIPDVNGVYSPDGSRRAYMKTQSRVDSLVLAEADGSDARKAASAGEFPEAVWSPTGDRVAYVRVTFSDEFDSDGLPVTLSSELRVRDVATEAETSLVRTSASERLAVLDFSPDGERILFSRGTEGTDWGVSALWSINADGSKPRRLAPRIEWADWRPPSP